MAKLSLSPKFISESFQILKRKSLKEILFGNKVSYNKEERKIINWINNNPEKFNKVGRKGSFIKKDIIHKGQGLVYLLPFEKNKSILLFDDQVKIRSGPDLYVYLSTKKDVRKGLGKIINLGLLKGTKGGQSYIVNNNMKDLDKYKSAVIYCKKFEELFTFAELK